MAWIRARVKARVGERGDGCEIVRDGVRVSGEIRNRVGRVTVGNSYGWEQGCG